ncbi:MAG: 16S rRNA (cytidine(1402)-2'-O)-methyltransferase [Devosiaceae bacterium]|nr:16S rRNA (cytidine(1402)-2'-O)-methyltransferase [Devosiaceae bacterium MH13]
MVNTFLTPDRTDPPALTLKAADLEAGLYVVATPIGNLGDITIRALETLAGCDVIACEDTRTSRVLLDRYGIVTPTLAYHDHNGPKARPQILARLEAGEAVALISDAGTPLIADPGYKLVVAARDAGHRVFAVPGPSALAAALSIAGQPTDSFSFMGFLPSKSGARRTAIAQMAPLAGTLCIYEAPNRLAESLSDLAEGLGANRPATVCREITKRFETVQAGDLQSLAAHYGTQEQARGEIVIIIGPRANAPLDEASVDDALRAALKTERVKDAAGLVAEAYGLNRREMYKRALELAKDADG